MTGRTPDERYRPKVSVLIHNLDRASALDGCLASVAAQTYRPLEALVFDAGSTDGSIQVIQRWIEHMRASGVEARWESCSRMGVPASRNHAAERATGDLLVMIDNDACFDEDDAVSAAVGEFWSDPGLGVLSFRVLDRESDAVDPRAWVFRRPAGSWAGCRFETFTFAGTGFCARAEAFREAGGFWDAFRYAREEEDLALALLDRRWRLVYSPRVTIRHFADPRGRVELAERRRMELRNGALVLLHRLPLPVAAVAVAARTATMSVRALAHDRIGLGALWRALPEALSRLRDPDFDRRPVSLGTVGRYLALQLPRQPTRPDDGSWRRDGGERARGRLGDLRRDRAS